MHKSSFSASNVFLRLRYAVIKPTLFVGVAMTLSVGVSAQVNPVQINSTYQTYVIHTYGGADLIPAVKQVLNGTASTVSSYQDKLVLRTTAEGYQTVQQLLKQIDQAPIPLRISVKVGSLSNREGEVQQGRIIINQHGVVISGNASNQNNTQQSNSLYQVNTLSGKSATIATTTLLSLAQNYVGRVYNRYGYPAAYIHINGQTLTQTVKGVALHPKILPNNQVELSITQVEDTVTDSSNGRNRFKVFSSNSDNILHSQKLVTTVTVPRGKWVSIGDISQTQQHYSSTSYSSNTSATEVSYPIQIKVE